MGVAPLRGATLAITLVLLAMAVEWAPQRWLRDQLFDGYQRLLPRQRLTAPATVVAIDERTLREHGQWPWPRDRFAELIRRIAAASPAAIGVDILWPEPDRLSPRRILENVRGLEPSLAQRIQQLPDNDVLLGQALRGRPVVLAMAGEPTAPAVQGSIRTGPVLVRGDPSGLRFVPEYPGLVRSRPEIETAAAGQGLINAAPEGVVRHMELLGRAGGLLLSSLELEMLRVASGQPFIEVLVDAAGVRAVMAGGTRILTNPDGSVWLRYGERDPSRIVSAADVLDGSVDPALFERKLVLIGPTGLGLVDQPATPLGDRLPGVEIRAQLLENVFDASWLRRPGWFSVLEPALFMALAILYVAMVRTRTPGEAFAVVGGTLLAVALGGLIAFNGGLLVDVASIGIGAALVFTVSLGATLSETQRQRRELTQRLAAEREAAARLAGELETARRVQMGMLPEAPGALAEDVRIDLRAFMEPARTVGGDLYDFFMLDERRLFVMIGDVSGKGLAAAMFMALIKSLCRSAVLRHPQELDRALAQAESEIKRENPESLFVTLLVLTLDLETGVLTYCNAGHDPVYGLRNGQGPRKLDEGGRPPLCVLDGYPYPLGRAQLQPGETLFLITDGITEAANPTGQLYGHKRLEGLLEQLGDVNAETLLEAVRQDVVAFAAGAEQADDMSIVALRWRPDPVSGR